MGSHYTHRICIFKFMLYYECNSKKVFESMVVNGYIVFHLLELIKASLIVGHVFFLIFHCYKWCCYKHPCATRLPLFYYFCRQDSKISHHWIKRYEYFRVPQTCLIASWKVLAAWPCPTLVFFLVLICGWALNGSLNHRMVHSHLVSVCWGIILLS